MKSPDFPNAGDTRECVRVLVVDDYEPWHRFVSKALSQQQELQIIGHVSDGLEAVHQAQQLQPDLILLDISLPTLNGIEAARRIQEVSPTSKILFVSENRSGDIVEAALANGAGGYVVKSDAGSNLLPAIKAVLEGKRFVSANLVGRDLKKIENVQIHDQLGGQLTSLRPPSVKFERSHKVTLCPDDVTLVSGFVRFMEAAVKRRDMVVIITTESHRADILRHLQSCDLDHVITPDNFIALDVADSTSTPTVDDSGYPVRFVRHALVEALNEAAKDGRHVTVG